MLTRKRVTLIDRPKDSFSVQKGNEYNAGLMFETQSTDEWLPGWLRSLGPFLISVFVAPFPLLIGLSDFGPEGPQLYVGYLIFPYAALMLFVAAVANNEGAFFISLLLALVQFPGYGAILSIIKDRKRAFIWITATHLISCLSVILALGAFAIWHRSGTIQ